MKHLALLWAGMLMLMLGACVTVEFRQPQPAGQPDLDRFPAAWEGTYLSEDDTFRIAGSVIRSISQTKEVIPVSRLDSLKDTYALRDGRLFMLSENPLRGFPYQIKDDTLYAETIEESEMGLSDSLRLRRYQGSYYISQPSRPDLFTCVLIEPQGEPAERLTIRVIDPGDEKTMEKLKKFMPLEPVRSEEGEVEYYIADPKPGALAKFAKAGGFGESYLVLDRLR